MTLIFYQANPIMGAVDANADALLAAAATAPHKSLMIAPELYLVGYPPDDLVTTPATLSACHTALNRLAKNFPKDRAAIVGTAIEHDGAVINGAAMVTHGRWDIVAEKMTLPNYGVFDDARVFIPGNGPGTIYWQGKHYGVIICEDTWFPEPLEKLLESAEHPLAGLISINASPYASGKQLRREAMLKERAHRLRAPVYYLNMVGGLDEVVFDGHSFAVDAHGNVTQQLDGFCEVTTAIVPQENIPPHACVEQNHWQAMVLALRDYVHKNGFSQVCLGLSGGVDSALVATIAVDALGAANVTAIIMPSPYSSDETQNDARAQADRLGIRAIRMPITPVQSAMMDSLANGFGEAPNDITAQNIQSRIRGMMLMAYSNQTGAMLLTTGNKSELAVGYATLYGDMNGGFNPIKDLYKTQVYDLCSWRNDNLPHGAKITVPILESIITRAPSAELKPDQRDQDTLPPYDILDEILMVLIEGNGDPAALEKFDAPLVQKIHGWLNRNEYKRFQSAPGPKLGEKAFGRDRRFPMTNKS